jgi:two-component system response regulator FlrC
MTGGQMDKVSVELFGKDLKIQKAVATAKNVSASKSPVLIVGETGVGKKSLAQFIHANSNRASQRIEYVDCSQDAQTVENEILGSRDDDSGRFNKGVLEIANGGTVVFANIDGIEEDFQKRLHQILVELEDYDIDIRIIATTSKNLSKLVGAGRFYRGLYVHVCSNSIYMPPLRERLEDLEDFAKSFATYYGRGEVTLSEDAIEKLKSHYWTHNTQELKSVIRESVSSVEDNTVTSNDLVLGEKKVVSLVAEEDNEGIRLMSLRDAEQLLIKKALVHTSENRTQAAKILGVSIRTLRNKINEYRTSGSSYFVNLR